jgi:hypothetical protein
MVLLGVFFTAELCVAFSTCMEQPLMQHGMHAIALLCPNAPMVSRRLMERALPQHKVCSISH